MSEQKITNPNFNALVRGFNGAALLAPEVNQDGQIVGNDFLTAMHRLALLPSDPEARARMQTDAQETAASAYGSPSMVDKPYAQVGSSAIIPVSGVLLNRFMGSYGYVTGYNAIRAQLNAALADESVDRIVLDVNSPGGMVAGCFELAADIRAARDVKSILAVVDGAACSAAYALASQASSVIAAPSAMVGSIGVVAMHMNMGPVIEMFGIEITFIYAGKHKIDGNPYQSLSDDAKAEWQARVDAIYGDFLALVEAGRGKRKFSADDARKTEARVYSARDALALGMVDAVSTPQAALSAFVRGDTPQQQEDETAMTEKTEDKGTQPDAAAIRAAERARVNGILTHAEAKGRESLANHLATNTEMSVEDAAAILAASPKATAPEQPQAKERDILGDAMKNTDQPNVGAEGGKGEQDAATRILSSYAAMTGATIPGVNAPTH